MRSRNSAARLGSTSFSISSNSASNYSSDYSHGRPEATYIQAKEAGPQHAQDGARGRHSEVSEVWCSEASASRLWRVRLLRRQAAGRSEGSVAWRASRWTPWGATLL